MRNSQCKLCPLHESSENVCVWGDGPKNADIMIIGEAPGEAEAETGKPFMGRSGKLLREELAAQGLSSRVYITNVAKCRPPDNRTPTPSEIEACSRYLKEEFETVKPKYVVTLGSTASKAVLDRPKITKSHGEIIQREDFIGMPIYHPAYTLYDMSKLPAFKLDIAKLADLVNGVQRYQEVPWAVVGRENIDEFIEEFRQAEEFSFDTETSGLFPYDRAGWIQCLSLGLPNRSWVLPLVRHDSPFYNHRVRTDILEILQELSKDKWAVAHNGKFDNAWLQLCHGIKFHLNFDTMLASHTLDENRAHDLKELSRTLLHAPEYDLSLKQKLYGQDSMQLYKYAAEDAANTLKLYRIFDAQLRKEPELRQLFYKLVMPAARAFENIECRGLFVDRKKMDQVEEETRREMEFLHKQLNEMVNREVNWNSPAQVSQVLFGELKLTPVGFTEKGLASTGEATLIELKDQHPVADLLIRYREAAKFLSTYIEGWKEFMVNDYLYLGTKLHGTVTGRYSGRLHQTPRDQRIRSLITNRGDWPFVQLDISQAEMRVACILSGDLELRRCFNSGIDVHWRTLLHTVQSGGSGEYVDPVINTARLATGEAVDLNDGIKILLEIGHERAIELWSGWKEGRKKAKGINFGFLFGMFEKKFIEYCKMKYGFEPTLEEAKRYRRSFFNLYSALEPWHNKQRKLTKLNGQVRNLAGRVRHLPGIESTDWSVKSEAERQGINSPVQGFVGDFKAMALVEIEETVPTSRFQLGGEHHDAILGYVEPTHMLETLKQVADIMRHPKLLDEFGIELSIPMEVEVTVGPWGSGKIVQV